MTSRLLRCIVVLAPVAALAAGCGSDNDSTTADSASATAPAVTEPASPVTEPAGAVTDDQMAAVAATYADLVLSSYEASLASATELQAAIDAFLAAPTDATMQAARDQWLAARDDYGPTEAFRFYDGPIDAPDTGPEGRINAWPMDEAYVDYVEDDPAAGIVNDAGTYPEITTDIILAANEEGGETNISTGWHAIEFLLWGQDLSADGPGSRPVTDYTTDATAQRRGTYLGLLADQLVADLRSVAAEWEDDGAYRTEFLADPTDAVQKLMRGIGALSTGELAGERMAVAFETKDQEDEHSCFSDNTNADVRNNVLGVKVVYLAEGMDGPSVSSLVAAVDPELDATLRDQIDQSLALVDAFPATFETMIAAPSDDPASTAFADALTSIETQGQTIAQAASALGLEISITV